MAGGIGVGVGGCNVHMMSIYDEYVTRSTVITYNRNHLYSFWQFQCLVSSADRQLVHSSSRGCLPRDAVHRGGFARRVGAARAFPASVHIYASRVPPITA